MEIINQKELPGWDEYARQFSYLEDEPVKPTKKVKASPKKKKIVSKRKGITATSDYLDFHKASRVGEKMLKDKKKRIMGLYIIIAINTGLRVGDILNLKWMHLKENRKGFVIVTEGKTKKARRIDINENISSAIAHFTNVQMESYIFKSQKGSVYSIQQINRLLKSIFEKESRELNISSHSLRKTFGRRVYDMNGESENALIYLSEIFQHSSMSITRRYLGIRQEELRNIYMNL
jgi:integrase